MKIFLYSDDMALCTQWQKKITLLKSEILDDITKLSSLSDLVLVLDYASCYKDIVNIVTLSQDRNIKILLLESTPSFEIGKKLLSLGVKGYGNILMNEVYLNSAIQTVQNEMIWIYPEFTTSLIQGFEKTHNIPNEIEVKLTKQELKIASLIKDGYTNQNISENLKISINTVKSHIKNIYEKLNVKNRLSLSLLFAK